MCVCVCVCVCVCDREVSIMISPPPTGGCCAMVEKIQFINCGVFCVANYQAMSLELPVDIFLYKELSQSSDN